MSRAGHPDRPDRARPVRGFAVAAVLALLVAAPTGQAQLENPDQSTPTTLYFHIWDTFNKFVINTQPYNASFFDVGGVNFPSHPEMEWDFNTIYGYSTAGPVEYEFIEAGRPRIHPERGIAADVELDPDVQPTAYLYVDARGLDGGHGTPSAIPEITFRATMRQGDDPGSDLDEGELLMEGKTTVSLFDGRWCPTQVAGVVPVGVGCDPVDPAGEAGYENLPDTNPATGNPVLYPDEDYVIEVPIPMEVASTTIPKEGAYNLRLDWYQEQEPATGEDEVSQGNLRLVLDDSHLPRLEMAVMNPVYIEFIHPQVAAGTLLIHTGVNSPWGTYDVDTESLQIEVDGPSEPVNLQRVVAQNQHVHGLHDKAAEITYLWKFRDEEAKQGDYTIRFSVQNLANTATASGTAGFTIEGQKAFGVDDAGEVVEPADTDEAQGSPAVGVLALVGLLVVAWAARRGGRGSL